MDKALFIPSSIIAGMLIILYGISCYRNRSGFDQKIITNLILQAFQIVCGAVLIASTFIPDLAALVSDLNLYILIAGSVLLVNSGQSAIRDVRLPAKNSDELME